MKKSRTLIMYIIFLTGGCANMPPIGDKTPLQDIDFCLNLDGLEFEHQLIFIAHAKFAAKLATKSIKALTGRGSIDIIDKHCRNFIYISNKPNAYYKGRAHRFTKTSNFETRLSKVNIEITKQAYMSFFDDSEVFPFGLTILLMHEMGHALGLDHSDELEDIMFPFYHPFQRLKYTEIKFMKLKQ